jgi:AAA15 family ATPase/GTPase
LLFEVTIKNIQHISELQLIFLKIGCIVGKNGIGKTTLVKAINNLQSTDTF